MWIVFLIIMILLWSLDRYKHTYTMAWFNIVYPHNPVHCQSYPALIRSRLRSKLYKKKRKKKGLCLQHCYPLNTAGMWQSATEIRANWLCKPTDFSGIEPGDAREIQSKHHDTLTSLFISFVTMKLDNFLDTLFVFFMT